MSSCLGHACRLIGSISAVLKMKFLKFIIHVAQRGLCDLCEAFQIITSTTTVAVPSGATTLAGLCIGGGSAGYWVHFGGGGSGYIAYNFTDVTPGSTMLVTIGGGSNPGHAADASSVGSFVVAPGGRNTGYYSGLGGSGGKAGSGGSGGGCGSYNYGYPSCDGGTCGSDGGNFSSEMGGFGQGTTYWSTALSFFNMPGLNITCGGAGKGMNNSDIHVLPGGGGGGGIIVNGSNVTAESGGTTMSGSGGFGYGAGGGSASKYYGNVTGQGGVGAPGVCILVYCYD